ncbi:MAG: DegT/DnrJ/EryC1/StrS family aminotransferase [Actinomycetaceae bacterium]|nr:DegT/DnrJ/EryC1/StrS family aminotransferase [Actinomycetaceae bacterium]
MAHSNDDRRIKQILAQRSHTRPEDWFLVVRARTGMESVFTQIASCCGNGTVITQAYTCVSAVNPIIAAGLTPCYADIHPRSLSLDPDKLRLDKRTKAVVIQHTFGIIDHDYATRVAHRAHRKGAVVVEDSAHCVTRMACSQDSNTDSLTVNPPIADVSIHSFGVEKILPTRFGGAVWVNPAMKNTRLRRSIIHELESLEQPPCIFRLSARAYLTELRILTRLPAFMATPFRNLLTKMRLFLPVIADKELYGRQPHQPYAIFPWASSRVLEALMELDYNEAQRREAVKIYSEVLEGSADIPLCITDLSPLTRFPLYVTEHHMETQRDPETVFERLKAAGHYPGRWYRPALFPGVKDDNAYNFDPKMMDLPSTKSLIDRAINLPTCVDADTARNIAQLTKQILS